MVLTMRLARWRDVSEGRSTLFYAAHKKQTAYLGANSEKLFCSVEKLRVPAALARSGRRAKIAAARQQSQRNGFALVSLQCTDSYDVATGLPCARLDPTIEGDRLSGEGMALCRELLFYSSLLFSYKGVETGGRSLSSRPNYIPRWDG